MSTESKTDSKKGEVIETGESVFDSLETPAGASESVLPPVGNAPANLADTLYDNGSLKEPRSKEGLFDNMPGLDEGDEPSGYIDTADLPEETESADSAEESSDEKKEETTSSFAEEFPDIGGELEANEQQTAEEAFDAETEAIVAKIEEKGHPGDVYRDLRQELKEAKLASASQASADLRAENEKLKAESERYAGMEERLKEIAGKSAQLEMESSAEYVQQVSEPIDQMHADLVAMSEMLNVDVGALTKVVSEDNVAEQDRLLMALENQLEEVEGISVRRQIGRIERMSDQYKEIQFTKNQLLADAENRVAASKAEAEAAKQEAHEKRMLEFNKATKSTFEKYAPMVPGFVDETGNLNDLAKSAQSKALAADVNNMSDTDVAFLLFAAKALPQLAKDLKLTRSENRDLKVATGGAKTVAKKAVAAGDTAPEHPAESTKKGLFDHMSDTLGINLDDL